MDIFLQQLVNGLTIGSMFALIALGYAGWASGQLEDELMNNAWLNGPANANIIFNTPHEECWHSAASQMGIDIEKLSSDIGHA